MAVAKELAGPTGLLSTGHATAALAGFGPKEEPKISHFSVVLGLCMSLDSQLNLVYHTALSSRTRPVQSHPTFPRVMRQPAALSEAHGLPRSLALMCAPNSAADVQLAAQSDGAERPETANRDNKRPLEEILER